MEILSLVFIIAIFLFSVVVHEVSHGMVANMLGDPTAKLAGRLTLNPLKHLDPLGSIILPGILILMSILSGTGGIIFGCAKPVPVNPYNFRDQKYGNAKVSIAGPVANLFLALFFGFFIRVLPYTSSIFFQNMRIFFIYVVWINLILFVFNLWPGFPFDGYHLFSTFFPSLTERLDFLRNPIFSTLGAILFMGMIGFPYLCPFLFKLITGTSIL